MSPSCRDLLIASPSRWDECCFAVPAVRALAASGLGVGILCEARQQSFWQSVAGIEVLSDQIETDWQAALLWQDGRLAKAVAKAGIQRRLGPPGGKLAKHLSHPLQHSPHPTSHRVQLYLGAAAEMGVETAKPEFFAPALATTDTPSVLLCPDSDFGPSHEWSAERWQQLGQHLIEQGQQAAIACLTGGRGMGEQLAKSLGGDLTTLEFDLSQAPLEALCGHSLVIAADGSVPHLAAHAGATCITLFGPNDAQWRRPLGKHHHVVRQAVECAPCLMAKCPLDLRCQKELEVERVLSAVNACL